MSDHSLLGPGREFDTIRALLVSWGARAEGIGDDGAVLDVAPGERLVVSTDTSVENVHFRREWLTPAEIGWRATMAALSDIAAMGARPLGVLTAITVPPSWRGDLATVADGIGNAVSDARTKILGGDLSTGSEFAIAVTVLGSAARPLTRSGARAGDAVFVSGALGGPALALRSWLAGETPSRAARERFARPSARLSQVTGLTSQVTACIDISDGLIADASHIAAASNVSIAIELDALPLFPGATAAEAAASGEEYELLVTAPASFAAPAFTRIGSVNDARGAAGVIATHGGARVEFAGGYDHFSR